MARGFLAVLLASSLALVGTAQQRSLTELKRAITDPATAGRAADGMVSRGPTSARFAVAALAHGSPTARRAGALVLRRLGPRASGVTWRLVLSLRVETPERAPLLLEAIADVATAANREVLDEVHRRTERIVAAADRDLGMAVRRAFVRALTRIRYESQTDGDVVEALHAGYAIAREFAAAEVARRPRDFRAQLEMLREVLSSDPAPPPRGSSYAFGERFVAEDRFLIHVAHAVESITGEPLQHLHADRYRLRYGDERARTAAAGELGVESGRASAAVPSLIEALDDPSGKVVGAAIDALASWKDLASPARSRLRELADSGDPAIAARAQDALQRAPEPR